MESKGTMVHVNVCSEEKGCSKGDTWKAFIQSVKDDKVVVSVTSPTHTFVGKHSVIVKLFSHSHGKNERLAMRKVESPIYILFNPWNESRSTRHNKSCDTFIRNVNALALLQTIRRTWQTVHGGRNMLSWIMGVFTSLDGGDLTPKDGSSDRFVQFKHSNKF